MRRRLVSAAKAAFPAHTMRGRLLRSMLPRSAGWRLSAAYKRYIRDVEPWAWRAQIRETPPADDPLFSVVIPMFNTPDAYLHPLLDSLTNQVFDGFEAILADASTQPERAAAIERAASADPRLHYLRLHTNDGISANTNAAIDAARAPYIVFADHDDTLNPHALNEVAHGLAADQAIDIVYSDEDVLSDDGLTRKNPFFKPAWSPHMFLECNYTNHMSVVRRSLISEVGGLRPEMDGAQDYDLLLRLHTLGRPLKVRHIPAMLYHWREAVTSTARTIDTKSYAVDAGRKAVAEYMQRVGVASDGVDDVPGHPGWYRVRPRWDVKVAVVSTDSAPAYVDVLRHATKATTCKPVWISQPDGFDAAQLPDDIEALVVVRQRYVPDDPTWLDDLVGALALPGATAVAPLLVGPSGRVDSAGFVRDGVGMCNLLVGCKAEAGDICGPTHMLRDVDALSACVVAVKRGDVDLVTADDTMIFVPQHRGHAVLWAHQAMTRRDELRASGYLNPHVGLGPMGWLAR